MDHSKRYENTLVAILFLTWGTVFLDRMSQLYLAPYIVPEFHLTHSQVGMLASVLAITWAISTLVFGALSDRIGRRPISAIQRVSIRRIRHRKLPPIAS
jgi:MFS family permease